MFITHGHSRHPVYIVWRNMKDRCYNKNCRAYKWYGARGILVDNDWLNIDNFIRDMYPSYKKGLHLDRIDNNKGYSKENCRRTTAKENMNNRRDNLIIGGMKASEIMGLTGFSYHRINKRIKKYGWTIDEILNETRQNPTAKLIGGYTMKQLSQIQKTPYPTIVNRARVWTEEEVLQGYKNNAIGNRSR